MEIQGTQNNQTLLKKIINVGGFTLPNFKPHKASVGKTVQYRCEEGHTEEGIRTETPGVHAYAYSSFILNQIAKTVNWIAM